MTPPGPSQPCGGRPADLGLPHGCPHKTPLCTQVPHWPEPGRHATDAFLTPGSALGTTAPVQLARNVQCHQRPWAPGLWLGTADPSSGPQGWQQPQGLHPGTQRPRIPLPREGRGRAPPNRKLRCTSSSLCNTTGSALKQNRCPRVSWVHPSTGGRAGGNPHLRPKAPGLDFSSLDLEQEEKLRWAEHTMQCDPSPWPARMVLWSEGGGHL